MSKLILAFLLIVDVICLIDGNFTCKEAEVVQDFNKTAFMGIWYEASRNPTIYDIRLKCVIYNATSLQSDILHLHINSKNIYSDSTVLLDGYLKHPNNTQEGLFKVRMIGEEITANLILGLIAADYNSYAIFQGCQYEDEIEYVWILTRKRILTDEEFAILYKLLEERGVKSKYLLNVQQKDCNN